MTKIAHSELKALLHYDPETGVFRWLKSTSTRIRPGMVAGSTYIYRGKRVTQVGINGRSYLNSRLAWFYTTGVWPTGVVDHIDGDSGNQRWKNLRDVTQKMNIENQVKASRRSIAGLLGVSWFARDSLWTANITVHEAGRKRNKYLGRFKTKEEAHQAYLKAKRQLHLGCTI